MSFEIMLTGPPAGLAACETCAASKKLAASIRHHSLPLSLPSAGLAPPIDIMSLAHWVEMVSMGFGESLGDASVSAKCCAKSVLFAEEVKKG